MDLFFGVLGTGGIQHAGSGWRDNGQPVVTRVQPRAVAPGGANASQSLHSAFAIVRHDGSCWLRLTPIIDSVVRSDLAVLHQLEAKAVVTDDVVRLVLTEPVTWPGQATAFSRQALRGIFATIRAELQSVFPAVLTVDPAGDDNALLFTGQQAEEAANDISIEYTDPAGNNQPLTITVVGDAIEVSLATDAGGVITSTAADILAAIEADTDASALVRVELAEDNDGTGVVTAMAAANLAGGEDETGTVLAIAGLEIEQSTTGVVAASIPVEA